jgi:hypothetical protein
MVGDTLREEAAARLRRKLESQNFRTPKDFETEDSQMLDAQANNFFDTENESDMYTHLMQAWNDFDKKVKALELPKNTLKDLDINTQKNIPMPLIRSQ